jgi:hypothetical protein
MDIAWIYGIKASNLAKPWHYAKPPTRLIQTSFAKSFATSSTCATRWCN